MIWRYRALLITVFAMLIIGCGAETEPVERVDAESAAQALSDPALSVPQRDLTSRDLEVIKFALTTVTMPSNERPCFLTTTPFYRWDPSGGWESLPEEFHAALNSNPTQFFSANQAYLKRGSVFELSSNKPGWMIWVTVTSWLSPTEVEVETGTWGGPADAVGATTIFEEQNGQWKVKKVTKTWLS